MICLATLRWLELWNNAMITLTATIVATVLVMILAAVVGVWMGRSKGVDRVIRPVLDARPDPAAVRLPDPGAGAVRRRPGSPRSSRPIAYAAPAAIKIVADGIKAVSAATVEAAESAGAITIQIITKVQIPMARSAFTVAANQGLLYVLSMVVIGGLVGAGALGYDVVAGFKQLDTRGRGLAAGFSIVLLGVMLDRITTYAARRARRAVHMNAHAKLIAPGRRGRARPGALVLPGVAASTIPRRRRGSATPCGDVNIAVNNWVGYEADAFVVGEVAAEQARLHGQLRVRRRADLLAGLRQRRRSTRSWRTGATPS